MKRIVHQPKRAACPSCGKKPFTNENYDFGYAATCRYCGTVAGLYNGVRFVNAKTVR